MDADINSDVVMEERTNRMFEVADKLSAQELAEFKSLLVSVIKGSGERSAAKTAFVKQAKSMGLYKGELAKQILGDLLEYEASFDYKIRDSKQDVDEQAKQLYGMLIGKHYGRNDKVTLEDIKLAKAISDAKATEWKETKGHGV